MHQIVVILFLVLILICMLFHVPIVITGAHTGLELWYESVLPSILPFMIITSLLLQKVRGKGICYLGLFCGLPVGANLVNQQYVSGQLNTNTANALLCICNITSPMFISGYILNQTLQQQVSAIRFFLIIYLPLIFYGLWCLLKSNRNLFQHKPGHFRDFKPLSATQSVTELNESSHITMSFEDIIKHSLQVILMVGIYIMLFCILIQFLLSILPSDSVLPKLLTASFEITNGIHLLMKLPIDIHQKTALIAGLTSFGGICSVLQTKSVLTDKGLSIFHYVIVKLGMGVISYLLALIWL